MTESNDPFANCPALRGRITDPDASFFRGKTLAEIDAHVARLGLGPDWRRSDAEIAASMAETRAALGTDDLWLFGYGSLMWDPGIRFTDVRYARLAGYRRAFCIVDVLGGRGTPEAPGMIAGLERGGACTGIAFRIPAEEIDAELPHIWRREMIVEGYIATIVTLEMGGETRPGLTFVVNPALEHYAGEMPQEERARLIATGGGVLGTSLQYATSLADHLVVMGLDDPETQALVARARALAEADAPPGGAAS